MNLKDVKPTIIGREPVDGPYPNCPNWPTMATIEQWREQFFSDAVISALDRGVILTPLQIYEFMRAAGFPGPVAVTMTAIALRESAGRVSAYNGNTATGDRSYGLLQINCLELGAHALILFGIADEKELFDPATNARAGFVLWGHSNKNLDLCWYISRDKYRQAYESHLPAAQASALASTRYAV